VTWSLIQLCLALLLLDKAASMVIRGSALIAALSGLPRLLMGALLIGLATNIPEFFVSGMASWRGHGELAFANPVGSTIANMGLILGIMLFRRHGTIQPTWLRDHGVPMLLAVLLLFIVGQRDITRLPAIVLLLGALAYIAWSVAVARRTPQISREVEDIIQDTLTGLTNLQHRWGAALILVALGIPLVWISSHWVLLNAIETAARLGIGEGIIGLSVIAFGTSLPELFTTLSAIRRGQPDTAAGILLGSNTFNALGVVGVAALLGRLPVHAVNRLYDLPVMIAFCCVPLVPLAFGCTPGRKTGAILLVGYVLYVYSIFVIQGVL